MIEQERAWSSGALAGKGTVGEGEGRGVGGKSPSGKSIEIQGGWTGRLLELLEPTTARGLSPRQTAGAGWRGPLPQQTDTHQNEDIHIHLRRPQNGDINDLLVMIIQTHGHGGTYRHRKWWPCVRSHPRHTHINTHAHPPLRWDLYIDVGSRRHSDASQIHSDTG